MTQEEIESELVSHRQQLLQIQQQQENRKRARGRLAKIVAGMAILYAATGMVFSLVSLLAASAPRYRLRRHDISGTPSLRCFTAIRLFH